MDTFVPIENEHVWMGHAAYNRSYWFGRTSIACGGIGTVPTIFEQRNRLGEVKTQKLAGEFHKLERTRSLDSHFANSTHLQRRSWTILNPYWLTALTNNIIEIAEEQLECPIMGSLRHRLSWR